MIWGNPLAIIEPPQQVGIKLQPSSDNHAVRVEIYDQSAPQETLCSKVEVLLASTQKREPNVGLIRCQATQAGVVSPAAV